MVVDLGVPEEGLRGVSALLIDRERIDCLIETEVTHLVTVSPEVVLGPDVLEGVLGLVLEGGAVRDVLPVLGPEPVGVDAGEDDGGDHDAAVGVSCPGVLTRVRVCVQAARTRWKACARCLQRSNG